MKDPVPLTPRTLGVSLRTGPPGLAASLWTGPAAVVRPGRGVQLQQPRPHTEAAGVAHPHLQPRPRQLGGAGQPADGDPGRAGRQPRAQQAVTGGQGEQQDGGRADQHPAQRVQQHGRPAEDDAQHRQGRRPPAAR